MAYQWRSMVKKRYHLSTNATKFLYREDHIQPGIPLILVEGFFDFTAIDRFVEANYKNQFSVTTGLIKSISAEQISTIINKKPSNLVIMFDRDSWFDYYKLKQKIPFNVDHVILPYNKDPDKLSIKEKETIFKELIK
jgi:hypothetical protein